MARSPEHEPAVKRLCRLADHISAETWSDGADWYPHEARWIVRQARRYGAPKGRAIDAFATLSPQVQLVQNRRALVALLRGERPVAILGPNVRKARHILTTGAAPSGPKVRAFACNLKGCVDCATVDVWAARAIGAIPPTTDARYQRLAEVYQGAAARLGVETRTLQAAVWLHVRGTKPMDDRRD